MLRAALKVRLFALDPVGSRDRRYKWLNNAGWLLWAILGDYKNINGLCACLDMVVFIMRMIDYIPHVYLKPIITEYL